MGKIFLALVIAAAVIIIGMLLYPTVHWNWININVTGFIPMVKAGMVVLSYGFLFFIAYAIYHAVKK